MRITEIENGITLCGCCLNHLSGNNLKTTHHKQGEGQIERATFLCERCGYKTDMSTARLLANLTLSIGEMVINRRITGFLAGALDGYLLHPTNTFSVKLSEGTIIEMNLGKMLKKLDFVSTLELGHISKDEIYKEGIHFLETSLKKRTEKLKKETGIEFASSWVIASLLATFNGKFTQEPSVFAPLIVQKLGPEHLEKKIIPFSGTVRKDGPVLSDSKMKVCKAITDDIIQVFGIYDFFFRENRGQNHIKTFGDANAKFRELGSTDDRKEQCLLEIIVNELPAIVLFPEQHTGWVFY